MKITPIDINSHRFAKRMRGFDPEEVRSFLNLVSGEFERLVIENNALKEELAQIKAGLSDYKERERIQIGRASCRERVEISVVDGVVKRKEEGSRSEREARR